MIDTWMYPMAIPIRLGVAVSVTFFRQLHQQYHGDTARICTM